MSEGWKTIESEPAVFHSLISDLGVKDVTVQEIYDLDYFDFHAQPLYGVVFLFKYQQDHEVASSGPLDHDASEYLWFAHQIIHNACASQAILSILLNNDLNLGDELKSFKDFTLSFPPDLRGEAMSNSDMLRTVHNSFSRADMFSLEESVDGKGEAPNHFVAYCRVNDCLFELDGLQRAPINHGPCAEPDMHNVLKRVVDARIKRYAETENHFSLLAIVKDRLTADGGASMSATERLEEESKRNVWRKEIERRKASFAGAVLSLLTSALRKKRGADLETWIGDAKAARQEKRKARGD